MSEHWLQACSDIDIWSSVERKRHEIAHARHSIYPKDNTNKNTHEDERRISEDYTVRTASRTSIEHQKERSTTRKRNEIPARQGKRTKVEERKDLHNG
jgi:hypothetical protein